VKAARVDAQAMIVAYLPLFNATRGTSCRLVPRAVLSLAPALRETGWFLHRRFPNSLFTPAVNHAVATFSKQNTLGEFKP